MAASLLRYGPLGMPWWAYLLLALFCTATGAGYATTMWWLDGRRERQDQEAHRDDGD